MSKCVFESVKWLTLIVTWLAGIVLAKGAWKLAALLVPPYGWYLIVERIMQSLEVKLEEKEMENAITQVFDEQLKEAKDQENPKVYFMMYTDLSEDGRKQRMSLYKVFKNELFSLADAFDFVKMQGKFPVLTRKLLNAEIAQ